MVQMDTHFIPVHHVILPILPAGAAPDWVNLLMSLSTKWQMRSLISKEPLTSKEALLPLLGTPHQTNTTHLPDQPMSPHP